VISALPLIPDRTTARVAVGFLKGIVNEDRETWFASSLVGEYEEEIVKMILKCIWGDSVRAFVTMDLSQLLQAMTTKSPAQTRHILLSQLFVGEFVTAPNATEEDRKKFVDNVMR
jgi:hypothetical protein